MLKIRKSEDREHVNHSWLNSYRSFSHEETCNVEQAGYSVLMGLNDELIQGGMGFGMESHQDVEIVTYVLSGELHYQDSLSRKFVATSGDVYRVTTGNGVRDSRYNLSGKTAHLLQLWVEPSQKNLPAGFEKKNFSNAVKKNQWCLIVSPYGRQGAVTINQDVDIYNCLLEPASAIDMKVCQSRHNYLYVVNGAAGCNGKLLKKGDALQIESETLVAIESSNGAELLWLDLPQT